MKFGFMSSVCPKQTLPELIDSAKRHNYRHLELRVEWEHGHGVELDATPAQLREARGRFEESSVALSCIATGVRFIDADAGKRAEQVELLKRYIDLSATVGASNIRFFGDPVPKSENPIEVDETLDWEAEGIRACDDLAHDAGIALCLETHGNLLASYVAEVIYRAEAKSTFINWHAGHHIRYGQSIDMAYPHLRGKIRHVHVNFGMDGPMPAHEQQVFQLLTNDGYDGFYSVEVINPEDPEETLKRHAELYRELGG
jgi:sugar phosphate isomerase/epimerase